MSNLPDFDLPKLAEAIAQLKPDEIDRLPFGVIGLDAQGVVRVYNATEATLSGRGSRPTHGRMFFVDVAPCMDNGYFKDKIEAARARGSLDIEFTSVGDFSERGRELTVRVQSATDGGTWIFHKRA
jgi:photoactive yellow protein